MSRSTSRRKEIRKAIVKALAGKTDARDNVRSGRSETNWQEKLPAINIYMRGEDCEDKNQAPRQLKREITFEIEVIASGRDGEDLEDKCDDIAEQVEICLSVDDSLDCTVDDIVLTSISEMEADSSGAKPFGSVRLLYLARYHEYSPRHLRDQGNFPDFKGADAQWITGDTDGDGKPDQALADRATDKIDIP